MHFNATLTDVDRDLVKQLIVAKNQYAAEKQALEQRLKQVNKGIKSLSDQSIADKFDVHRSTIQRIRRS